MPHMRLELAITAYTEGIPHRPWSIARELIPCRPLYRRRWNPISWHTSWPGDWLS